MTELQHLIETGVALHQSGRLAEAEARYRQVLTANPDHAEALHLLGVLAGQAGRPDAAVGLIERSLMIAPANAEARFNLANALAAQSRFSEAISHYQQVLNLHPAFVEAMVALGHARHALGDRAAAIDIWQKALQRAPTDAMLLFHLATAKYEAGDISEAIELLQKAAQQPGAAPEIFNSLGAMLGEVGRNSDAIAALRKAMSLRANYPEAMCNLGDALREARQENDAADMLKDVLRLRPDWPLALGNLGNLQRQRGDVDDAITTYRRAIAGALGDATLRNNLGIALREKLDVTGAIESHRAALLYHPDSAETHYALAWSLLLKGDFEAGWKEFEWRLRLKRRAPNGIAAPTWDGREAKDKTLLVFAEQGFGDTIQFLRYLPLIRSRVGRLIVAVPPELVSLARDLGIETAGLDKPLPAHDLSFPLMSSASVFGLAGMTEPYIHRRREVHKGSIRVGIVWSGRSTYSNDRNRSISAQQLEPLQSTGVEFHSLQPQPSPAKWIVDHTKELTDFRATADLIAALDMVISVDTAVAHLAAAMGKPMWILLPYSPDWRWMLNRDDSPWYPSARLFRQTKAGEWKTVIDRVANELKTFAQLPRPASD